MKAIINIFKKKIFKKYIFNKFNVCNKKKLFFTCIFN